MFNESLLSSKISTSASVPAWSGIGRAHHAWVERMGWHNKSVLESLALIGSEIGEVAGECDAGSPTGAFGEELADIALRTLDLAQELGVDLDAPRAAVHLGQRSPATIVDGILQLMQQFGMWVNSARVAQPDAAFFTEMLRFFTLVEELAKLARVDLVAEVTAKMARNEQRGSRGRII